MLESLIQFPGRKPQVYIQKGPLIGYKHADMEKLQLFTKNTIVAKIYFTQEKLK